MGSIDDVKERTDIVELIGSSGVSLRKTGRSFVGFCPFHANTRTPAFTVYPESQSFYCFGCHASGTAFDYLMRKEGLEFREALEELARRAGVQLAERSDEDRQLDAQRTRLLEICAAAAKYFNYVLLSLARAQPGRDYVAKRELSPETVESFQIGYSLDDWGHLLHYLTEKKGYTPESVEAAGLAVRSETRGYYDRFRGRLIFPIRNGRGEVVGFGGRALGDGQPKYLNTPETLLYKKGDLLYGLDLARDAVRAADATVVVEGYIDVLSAHQHGFRNVVAPLGTALTRNHVAMLKKLSHNVFLALDADAAGQKATLRGLDALQDRSAEEGEGRVAVSAEGAVRMESDVNLKIIRMPEGRDPDEVIKGDPELWQRLIGEAVPVMDFYIDAYTSGLDLSHPQGQSAALDRLPLSNRLLRDVHKALMQGVRGEHKQPGEWRQSQNWIGGTSLQDAAFIPPPHHDVPALMSDLEKFWHNDAIHVPHLIRIAISHYQFETFHPFLDGNGRVGRLLITLYLISNGLLAKPSLYLSSYFERHRAAYYDAFTTVRGTSDLGHWLRFFLRAVRETARTGVATFQAILRLRADAEHRVLELGQRAGNARRTLTLLYRRPLVTVNDVAEHLEVTHPTANRLVGDLVRLGLLRESTGNRRNRRFVFFEYLSLFMPA